MTHRPRLLNVFLAFWFCLGVPAHIVFDHAHGHHHVHGSSGASAEVCHDCCSGPEQDCSVAHCRSLPWKPHGGSSHGHSIDDHRVQSQPRDYFGGKYALIESGEEVALLPPGKIRLANIRATIPDSPRTASASLRAPPAA